MKHEDIESTVILFGGSFNPPHEGHFEMATHLYQTLKTDEIWMLFSQNPDKDPKVYAPLEHRMAMARILSRHYDPSIILSNEEARIASKIGRNDTYYILEELHRAHPECKFIWAMGADSFANFHLWRERDDILERYVVAVVGRPGYTKQALKSPTARDFSFAAFDHRRVKDLRTVASGWCFLEVPQNDLSSTALVEKFHRRERDFKGHFTEVADYVYANGLYDTGTPSSQVSQEPSCLPVPNYPAPPPCYMIGH